MSAPSLTSNLSHVLPPLTMTATSSPPRPASMKPATPPAASSAQDKAGSDAARGPVTENKHTETDQRMSSPPLPKLPEAPISPKYSAAPSSMSSTSQAPAQLALMLSTALADVDALKKALSEEKRRVTRAERLLQSFQSHTNTENGVSDEQRKDTMSEGALKAVLDAEARAERAERARDDALHALHSITTHFAELERYESLLSLRASDARSAFTRLLTNVANSYPPPASSPTLSGSPPALGLPALPAPLPAPSSSLPVTQFLVTSGTPVAPPSSFATRHTRNLPSHVSTTLNYPSHGSTHARQTSHSNASTFSGLPLPPPPSASGLGATLGSGFSAPPPSSSSSFSVPAKRAHRSRSLRGLDDGVADSGPWEDSKRRRVGPWDMEVDELRNNNADQPLPYPQHQPPLSAQPTQRIYDRERDRLQSQQSFARNGAPYSEANGTSANGMVRVDARELVRDAKERERRERGLHHPRKEGDASRRRRRSASRDSGGSSWSIDEMLLETATERREDGRPSSVAPQPEHQPAGNLQPQVYGLTVAPPPPSSNVRGEPPFTDRGSKKVGSHSSQASASSMTGLNGLPNEREKPGKVPATQLMTLGPGGVVVSGGGQATAPLPGGGFPAYNASGQRICRQCGAPGRYKDGKCVEKWGPGPEGPGTVCDRCRKKMKRVERRGTMDSAMAAAQHQAFSTHRESQGQLHVQPTLPLAPSHSQAASRSRAPTRTDTLLLDPRAQNQGLNLSPRHAHSLAYSHERERSRDGRSRGSSRSRSPGPTYHPLVGPSAREDQIHSQSQNHGHRRAPTPPYINSISTREQDDDGDGDGDEETNENGNADLDVDAELAQAAEVENEHGPKSRDASRSAAAYSSSSSLSSVGSRSAPNGSVHPPRRSSRASSASTTTAYEHGGGGSKTSRGPANGTATSKPMPLPSVATMAPPPSQSRLRYAHDDSVEEDNADGDADAEGSGDVDADAEFMDAVNATMKVEE